MKQTTKRYNSIRAPNGNLGGRRIAEAEVWPTYNREAKAYDQEILDQWNTDMDVTVIAVGLFSAVLTGFIVEASHELQEDFAETTSELVVQLAIIIRASIANDTIPEIVVPTFEPSGFAKIVNGLLYCSLGCALIAGVFALVVKVWIREYRDIPKTDPHDEALQRQFRFDGLQRWKISAWPRLVSQTFGFSLLLGSAGCLTRAWYIHWTSALALAVPFVAGTLVYYTTILLGSLHPDCPYKAPFSTTFLYTRYFWKCLRHGNDSLRGIRQHGRRWFEREAMAAMDIDLDIAALKWLIQFTPSRTTVQEAISWAFKRHLQERTVMDVLNVISNVVDSEPSKASFTIEPIMNLLEDTRPESLRSEVKTLLLKMAAIPPLDVQVLSTVLESLCLLIPDRPILHLPEDALPNVNISTITAQLVDFLCPLLGWRKSGISLDESTVSKVNISGLTAIMELAIGSLHDARLFNVTACLIFSFLPYTSGMTKPKQAEDEMASKLRTEFIPSLQRWLSLDDHSHVAPQIYQVCSQMVLRVRSEQPDIDLVEAIAYGLENRFAVMAKDWAKEDEIFQELREIAARGDRRHGVNSIHADDQTLISPSVPAHLSQPPDAGESIRPESTSALRSCSAPGIDRIDGQPRAS